ncbi:hypothetical protein FQA39_LY07849 [Lamprigera yunnana]|nr:hypothetical protein FQA39_LY07849 [Lamprigera yunnana]
MLSNTEYLTESPGSEEPEDAVENRKNETLVELLVAEYSKRPALYNEKLPLIERSRSIKKALELEVYSDLQGEMSIEDIRKKWNYLKKEYRKQHSQLWKYLRSGISLEEATAIIGKPLWKHYPAILSMIQPISGKATMKSAILSNVLYCRETESNISRVNEECSSGISSASPSSTGSTKSKLSKVLNVLPFIEKEKVASRSDTIDRLVMEHLYKENLRDPSDHFCAMLTIEKKIFDEKRG